jgi:Fe-S-cluster containining protein
MQKKAKLIIRLKKKMGIIGQSCSQCGICCRMFLINLNKKEWLTGWYKTQLKEFFLDKDFDTVLRYGGNILCQKKDGSCIYLKNNLCSIHKRRPKYCRDFYCSSSLKKFKTMIDLIKKRRKKDKIWLEPRNYH